jgi:uncharacterized protein with NRDE domain
MCLILFSYGLHPEYPLILTGNRDEFYDRPTQPLGYWTDTPHILAGRDLKGNGTWLGTTLTGKVAAITNFRDPGTLKDDAPSRGGLIKNFLCGTDSPRAYLTQVKKTGHHYNGFNLIAGDENELWYYSNQGGGVVEVAPGMHGLSNHFLDTPWPKVEKGKSTVAPVFSMPVIDIEAVFDILADSSFPPISQLPDTGVGEAWERLLSPLFIVSDTYGTRSSSIVLIHKTGLVTFVERTYTPEEKGKIRQHTLTFKFKRSQNAVL